LGKLGAVNALAGSFTAALTAALTVYWMTKAKLPVSTTQAVVGAIVGWNWFTGSITDLNALTKIVGTWIAAPILGGIFGALLYKLVVFVIGWARVHMLSLDMYTRIALVLAGAFGSYSLGANNIGNVMGVFVSSSPFADIEVGELFRLSSVQQLFLLGAIAIGVGVFTYSKQVMMTVGSSLMPLTPVAAFVVVLASSLVLFIFASTGLEHFLIQSGLPAIPLIPVSSSQAVVGAIIGIGLLKGLKGARQIRWSVLANIAGGWVATPVIAALVSFSLLFVVQNVFKQQVHETVNFSVTEPVLAYLEEKGIPTENLEELKDRVITPAVAFRRRLRETTNLTSAQQDVAIEAATIYDMVISAEKFADLDRYYLSDEQIDAVAGLHGDRFRYKWALAETLASRSKAWRMKPAEPINKIFNQNMQQRLDYVAGEFHVAPDATQQ
jgi:PiT family inorganic phosphate transporter